MKKAILLLFIVALPFFGQLGSRNAKRLQGRMICTDAPSDGNAIAWNASSSCYKPTALSLSSGFSGILPVANGGTGVAVPGIYRVDTYGATGDGSTDDYADVMEAIQAAYDAGGGTVCFSPGKTYRINSQIVIPNDGGSSPIPKQANIRLTACGGGGKLWWYSESLPNTTSSVIDLRYAGSGHKLESYGNGALTIDSLTIKDGGTSNATGFIHATNTTATIRDNTFVGSGNTGQDFVILGGTSTSINGSETGAFQGYGSVVESNTFANGNRGVYGLTYANAISVKGNAFVHNVGTVAIEFDGSAGDYNYGNYVSENIIEMDVYTYGVKLIATRQSQFIGNQFHDPDASTTAYFNLTDLSTQNTIVCGPGSSTYPLLSGDATNLAATSVLCAQAAMLDSTGKGVAATEFAYGAVVKGTYDDTKNYPGPLTVSDMFNSAERISVGYDHSGARGVIDVKNNTTATPLAVLSSAFQFLPPVTGNVLLKRGASQSGDLVSMQWGASANDTVSVSSIGTLYGQSNAAGIKWQHVLADGSYRLASDGQLGFNSATNLSSGGIDTTYSRCAANVHCFGVAQGGFTGTVKATNALLAPVAVVALPTCNIGALGTRATVNDASSPTIGATVTGGAAAPAAVWCNGSAWTVTGI